jgi:predicted dinucleotide-binding enzyme
MNISILGTGKMARAIATRMLAGGNNVTLYSRTPDKAAEMVDELLQGAKKGASVNVAKLGSSMPDPVVINTIWYPAVLEVVRPLAGQLSGKILVDITNALNQSFDDLSTPPGTSAAEEIAKVLSKDTRVLKAFNTTFAGLLSQGKVAGQPLDVFIAGDDESAKATLAKLVEGGGLHPLDVGPLHRAQWLEVLGALNITLQSKVSKPWMSSFKLLE